MGDLWVVYGLSMGDLWAVYGRSMADLWVIYGSFTVGMVAIPFTIGMGPVPFTAGIHGWNGAHPIHGNSTRPTSPYVRRLRWHTGRAQLGTS